MGTASRYRKATGDLRETNGFAAFRFEFLTEVRSDEVTSSSLISGTFWLVGQSFPQKCRCLFCLLGRYRVANMGEELVCYVKSRGLQLAFGRDRCGWRNTTIGSSVHQ